MEAIIAMVSFCVMSTTPPECGYIEDNRGPYETVKQCEVRIDEMFGLLRIMFPPELVRAEGKCFRVKGEQL
jgi:hypothetical protein